MPVSVSPALHHTQVTGGQQMYSPEGLRAATNQGRALATQFDLRSHRDHNRQLDFEASVTAKQHE
jgi:hypothetical protein